MTSTIIVHNNPTSHVDVVIVARDQVYDHAAGAMSDEWKDQPAVKIEPGCLYQGYVTTTRQVVVSEVQRQNPAPEPLLGKAQSAD